MSAFPGHLQALLSARAYPDPVRTVRLIETHVSWVLLTGEFAYKIKRPVQHPFVDQRSAEQRLFLCQEEVRLNRRFAPELYLGVEPITATAGEARLGGSGPVIEYTVRMRQFSAEDELDRLLESSRIEPAALGAFGHELARIHARLPAARSGQDWGKPAALSALVVHNAEECARAGQVLGDATDLGALSAALEVLADETLPLRLRRFAAGHVRECHADLHTRNIVRQGAQLLAFDCLEFDPALRWIDTADEISFLLADLETRQRPLHAHAFLSGYLEESGDYQCCALLRLFKAHRALVRAKITALTARQSASTGADLGTARGQFAAYVECARRAVTPGRPVLLLMCGLSGSGKSWLARRLAPPLGAVHLRSDIERRRLAGLSATEHSSSGIEQGVYSRAATAAVYDCLAQYAADTLAGGCTTIVDATFARREDRTRFRDLAARLGANTCIVYCRAPRELLQTRILERQRRQDDPSEADLAVLSWQETHFTEPQEGEASAVLEAQSPDRAAVELLIRRVTALSR